MARHNLNIYSTSQSEGAKPLLPGRLTKPSPGKEERQRTNLRLARHPPVKTFTSLVQGDVSHTTTNLRFGSAFFTNVERF